MQAVSGLTFSSGLRDEPPAGWGYSYMDHTGAYFMATAILMALYHRNQTGEGQWVDLATTEAGAVLNGPALLDYTVNGRPLQRPGMPNSNRSQYPRMAPHGIYPAEGDDCWLAIACRDDRDWQALASIVAEPWSANESFATIHGRVEQEDELDRLLSAWSRQRGADETAALLQGNGIPAAPVRRPEDRIERDPNTREWGLWPTVEHSAMGEVRVDGLPVHLSRTDWQMRRGGPCLGEHNDLVLGEVLGYSAEEIAAFRAEGVI